MNRPERMAAVEYLHRKGTEAGPEVLEWVEPLDWKAYAQAVRVHTHEHQAQVERTVAALTRNQ